MENLERILGSNTLAVPAVAVASGIFISSESPNATLCGFVLIILALLLYIAHIHYIKDAVTAWRLRMFHYLWLAIAFVGVGMFLADMNRYEHIDTVDDIRKDVSICGEVQDVREMTSGDVLTVKVRDIIGRNGVHHSFKNLNLIVKCGNADSGAITGDVVVFKATVEDIKDNPNSFFPGYKDIMASKGVFHVCHLDNGKINVIDHHKSALALSREIRNRLECFIENTSLSKKTQNFIITVLLGDRAYLDADTRAVFADAGVAHVLALSGMHMGIIGGILLFLLYPVNFAGRYKFRILLAAILLWGYAFITGMAPSTVRACVMVSFASLALVLERKRYVFNSLFAATLIILIVSPSTLYDAGFQLSFTCVASMAAFASHLNPLDRKHSPYSYKVVSLLVATLAATCGSWVVSAFYFKTFPLAFIPSNLLLLPILPFYVAMALCHLILIGMGIELSFLKKLLDTGFELTEFFLRWIGNGNNIEAHVTIWIAALWFAGLLSFAFYLNIVRWRPFLYVGTILTCITLVSLPFQSGT
ncbi:MAG: ComEC/Rec2 family competence protein, partial [Muribaculaceae bacterium]|nr:ComEC/Rec2 family competence protein [Muribaculaceae bacterium]